MSKYPAGTVAWAFDPTDAHDERPVIILSHENRPFSSVECTVMCLGTGAKNYDHYARKLPLPARSLDGSLPGGGAFMWTPGNQSPATGRGPSSVIVPRFKRTSTGASPPEDICDERSRWCSFRAYRSPMFFAAL